MKKNALKFLLAVCILGLAFACAWGNAPVSDKLFQVALLQSLMQGEYDGVVTVGELKEYGDTGIGTFKGVNGEMIVLDGTFYRAVWDGSVEVAPDDETVPFSNVTFFDSDIKAEHVNADSSSELKSILNSIVRKHGRNQFYMAKVTGLMPSILVRSELEQKEPQHFAVRQYAKYKLAAGKTAKSILVSCGARLAPFDIAELRELTSYDEMELDKLGDRLTALFVIISSSASLLWSFRTVIASTTRIWKRI